MKKILPFFVLALVFSSCQKDPSMSELDADFVVFTDYDKNADFSSFTNYYIPDEVLVIGGGVQPKYWRQDEAIDVIPTIVDNMNSRGYTQVTEKEDADFGVQVSFIQDISYFYNYNSSQYWWWGYPGYWSPGYWGGWGGWYYPYPVSYSYSVGSLLVEIVDLRIENPTDMNPLPLVWTGYMTGLLSGSDKINTQLSVRAINQAFAQSPYIKK